jgi:hypothetical protein
VLHDQLRVVFENEMVWTRMVAVGVLHDLNGTTSTSSVSSGTTKPSKPRLVPFYGKDTEKVGALLEEHIALTSEVFHEIHSGIDFRTILPTWYANGEAIAAQLSGLNPEHWAADQMSKYWRCTSTTSSTERSRSTMRTGHRTSSCSTCSTTTVSPWPTT